MTREIVLVCCYRNKYRRHPRHFTWSCDTKYALSICDLKRLWLYVRIVLALVLSQLINSTLSCSRGHIMWMTYGNTGFDEFMKESLTRLPFSFVCTKSYVKGPRVTARWLTHCSVQTLKSFNWFLKIQEAASRTTASILGLFVLIWLHLLCWIQVWQWLFCFEKSFELKLTYSLQ